MKKLQFLLIAFLLYNCAPNPDQKSQQFQKELESREITRITDGQLNEYIFKLGNAIVDTILKSKNDSLYIKIESKYGCKIYFYNSNSEIKDIKTAQLWDAYQYQIENNQPLENNIQKIDEKISVFTYPISENKKFKMLIAIYLEKKSLILNFTDKTIKILP